MAQAFNLTAQLQLQSPRNVNQVVNDIRRQLKPVGVQVKIENTRNLARANKDLAAFGRNARNSNKNMSELNRTLQESARRFSVITIATGSFLALANAFKKSVKEAIAFERELVKISQVTGKSVSQLKGLSQEVTRLSTTLGASASDLLNVARTLSQAGFAAEDARRALDILAKTTLAATFDNIQDTTEGAIALLRQFGNEAKATGGDIKFLESSLDAINSVSKRFAVESGDLITAIRRTGGVFSAAGGSINELIALFTSVRATTRESAETIATGLRTIFTRIQRVETIDQLRTLGVELQDAQGNFVGAFEAFKRLSQGLKGLDPRSVDFSSLVEELGGFRQVGKVIPLIQQFTTAQQALSVAQGASGSTARDAQIAQQSLGVQIQKVREQFDALIRKFADSSTFRSLANGALELAKAFIKIADSLEPLLPLLVSLVGLKLGQGIAPALAGLAGVGRRAGGTGPVTKFASGGMVPGSGNRDTVPAMLTPGEFVIRKSSVNKLGASNLAAMNENRYADGGFISTKRLTSPRVQGGKTIQNTLSANRGQGWTSIDEFKVPYRISQVDPYSKSIPKKLRDQYSNSQNASKRGFAFENIVSRVKNRRLNKNNAFLDAKNAEIKSDKKFSEKKSGGLRSSAYKTIVAKTLNTVLSRKKVKDLNFTSKKDQKDLSSYLGAGQITVYTDPGIKEWESKNKNLGGLIQKFAAGGIVGQKAAGAAILDPEPASSKSVSIGVEDVKKKFSEFSKLAKGKDPVSKFYKSTSFNVAKSGLNKETSNKFKIALEDGLISGINTSASILANDLGTPNAKIDQSQATNFVKGINTQVFGRLFETTVDSINRQGNYDKPDTNPNRPFDAEQGLPSVLKDNFKGLPDKFIDLKTSAAAASDANLKGKILDQIKIELIRDGILNADYPGKAGKDKDRAAREAKDEKQRQADKAAGRGFPARRNAGGPAPSDTVPALLTPGEFVFNKKAADSIGRANLDRMNKQGVQGFAKGGSVGVQRFQFGGTPSAVPLGANAGALDDLVNSAKRGSRSIDQLGQSSKRASVGFAERANSVASAAQQFVFLGSTITALTSSFSGLDDVTQTAINRTSGELVGIVGIVGTLTQVFTAAAIASKANAEAIIQETVVRKGSGAAPPVVTGGVGGAAAKASKGLKGFGAAILGLVGGPWGLLVAGVALLTGAFLFAKNKVKAENEALAKSAKDLADKFKETGEGLDATRNSILKVVVADREKVLGKEIAEFIKQNPETPSRSGIETSTVISDEEKARRDYIAALREELKEVKAGRIKAFSDSLDSTLIAFKDLKDTIKEQNNAYDRINNSVFDSATKFDKLSSSLVENQNELSNVRFDPSIMRDVFNQFESAGSFQDALENPAEAGDGLVGTFYLLQQETNRLAEAQKFAAENVAKSTTLFNQALGEVDGAADIGDLSKFLSPIQQQPEDFVGPSQRGLSESTETANTNVERAFKNVANSLRQEARFRILQLKIQAAALKAGSKAQQEAEKQIREIQQSTNEIIDEQIKYAEEVGAIRERQKITEAINREAKARNDSVAALKSFNDTLDDLDSLIARTRGQDPDSFSNVARRNSRRFGEALATERAAVQNLQAVGVGGGVRQSTGDLVQKRENLVKEQTNLDKDDQDRAAAIKRSIDAIDKEIERRTDQTDVLDNMKAAMRDNLALINKERQARKQVLDVLEEFVVGGEEARQNLAESARGVQLAIGTGTLQNQSEEQRKATVSLLKRLGDAPVTFDRATGAQLSGEDVLKRLLANDLFSMGAGGLAQAVLNSTSTEQLLIKSNETLYAGIIALKGSVDQAIQAQNAIAGVAPVTPAKGGLIQYRAKGGSIFKPKGTDTVPAMLSPGEFVIRKSAVDQIGVDNLQALNNGVKPAYRSTGSNRPEKRDRLAGEKLFELEREAAELGAAGKLADTIRSDREKNVVTGQKTLRDDINFRIGEIKGEAIKSYLSKEPDGGYTPQRLAQIAQLEKDIKTVEESPDPSLEFYNPEVRAQKQAATQREIDIKVASTAADTGYYDNLVRFGSTGRQFEKQGERVQLKSEDKRFDPFNRIDEDGIERFVKPIQETKFASGRGKSSPEADARFAQGEILLKPLIKDPAAEAERRLIASGGSLTSTKEGDGYKRFIEIEQQIIRENKELKEQQEAIKAERRQEAQQRNQELAEKANQDKLNEELFNIAPERSDFRQKRIAAGKARKEAADAERQERIAKAKAARQSKGVPKEFMGPVLPGETREDQTRDTFRTRGRRRISQQRRGFDVDAIRRERGMRSRGRAPGGQRFGGGAGIGAQAINFLSGYGGGGGFGGGGVGTVPFGFIPGSPYNQLLGRGGYNIPRFDPRLLFGNVASFFNKGGSVGGDTIPAMLTPGEFVMSAGAVKKHGVGLMNKLNKGNVQGFNKGGSVGGVQYRQEGGLLGATGAMLGFDTSEIQGVFDGFVANFSSVLDNIVAPFNNVVQNLNQLSQAFGNLTMQHTVNVEGLISIGGLNIESIKNELSQSIGEMVAGEVQRVMNDQQKNFKSN